MSTELCINLNDELTHSYPNYSGLASMGYSSLKTKERELLNETLSGNVSKEYAFCEKYLKLSRYSIIQNQIGTKVGAADVVACFEKACRYGAMNKYDRLTFECFIKTMENSSEKVHKIQRLGLI